MLTGLELRDRRAARGRPRRIAPTSPASSALVARRPRVPLPPACARSCAPRAGSTGPGAATRRVERLEQLPVVVDSWDAFDRLFAWDRGRCARMGARRCATYLGAAVRSFFAHGGRRAVIVRVGDPWPYLGGPIARGARAARLARAGARACGRAVAPFDPPTRAPGGASSTSTAWREASHVCLPDLADACAAEPQPPAPVVDPPPGAEVFVECSACGAAAAGDRGLRCARRRRAATPTASALGRRAIAACARFPRPPPARRRSWSRAAAARSDARGRPAACTRKPTAALPAAERRARGRGGERTARTAASAFVQLAWPWLATARSADLPQRLEPADGLLAGAARGQRAGARHVPLGRRDAACPRSWTPSRSPVWGLASDSPTGRARRARLPDRARAGRLGAALRRHQLARLGLAGRRREPADGEPDPRARARTGEAAAVRAPTAPRCGRASARHLEDAARRLLAARAALGGQTPARGVRGALRPQHDDARTIWTRPPEGRDHACCRRGDRAHHGRARARRRRRSARDSGRWRDGRNRRPDLPENRCAAPCLPLPRDVQAGHTARAQADQRATCRCAAARSPSAPGSRPRWSPR